MDDLLMEYEGNKPATPTERERRRRLAATVTICGLAFVGIGQLSTGAWFTDSGTANVQFATGDVQVSLDGPTGTTGQPRTLVLPAVGGATGMAPGDTKYRAIEVENTGSLEMWYAVTGSSVADSGGDLTTELAYSIATVATEAGCDASAFGGTTLFGPATIGGTETNLIGTKADTGNAAAGDRKLGSTDSEWLCLRTALPTSAGNSVAKSEATLTLSFYAVQTANNT
jgi:hypothetical protein